MFSVCKNCVVDGIGEFVSVVEFDKEDQSVRIIIYLKSAYRKVEEVVADTMCEALTFYKSCEMASFEYMNKQFSTIAYNLNNVMRMEFSDFQCEIVPINEEGKIENRLAMSGYGYTDDLDDYKITKMVQKLLFGGFIIPTE